MARGLAFALVLAWFLSGNDGQARESFPNQNVTPKEQHVKASPFRRGPVERRDLAGALGPRICGDVPADPKALWEIGIFDAQMEGVRLSAKTQDRDALLTAAQKKSRNLARMNHMGGFAYGICGDGAKAWAVAVPSPEPIVSRSEVRKITLPTAALKDRCASFRVDFAAESSGQPKKIPIIRNEFVDASHMGRGVVSITCQPSEPSWQGPVLWALIPLTQDFDLKMPTVPTGQGRSLTEGLRHWIAQIRAKEGLSPLIAHYDLEHYADLLAIDGSLRHNRTQLTLVAKKLRDTDTSPIGEDRVRARDLESMAWLLWNSPRHRGLLLDPAASSIGIGLKSLGSETLAVILTGKTERKTTVLRDDSTKRKLLR